MPIWRTGRTLGRTLYVDDRCIGMVDTPELAQQIAVTMNIEARTVTTDDLALLERFYQKVHGEGVERAKEQVRAEQAVLEAVRGLSVEAWRELVTFGKPEQETLGRAALALLGES